ncbi:iron-containing alcohol dehydrogenase [Pigmentiphaga soli]|uniref:Iron-containing alcohol dehydrogenase n=1 Tax=Pigmentiphaga soli TaxID=1007095 RepID=A0ABP8H4R0_9BURK
MIPIQYLTNIILAPGCVAMLPDTLGKLGVHRPLLVTDKGVRHTAAFERIQSALGAGHALFDDTPQNPTEHAVESATALFRDRRCDGVVAVGGGSPIDLSKAVALLATHQPPLSRYALIMDGLRHIRADVAPVVALPTTAGTGSEVGRGALITLRDGRKLGLISQHLIPKYALCDPELTLSLPPRLTAATGMDALAHCIETFLSPRDNPVADAIALDGAGRAYRNIESAVRNGSDLRTRQEMMTASLMGGLCFQKGLGAVHSLSHALGAIKNPVLHHGTLNAILLPSVLRANAAYAGDKYPRLLAAMHLATDTDLPAAIEALNGRLGIPSSLKDLGVTRDMLPGAVRGALADHSHATNPFQPDAMQYMDILDAAMQ